MGNEKFLMWERKRKYSLVLVFMKNIDRWEGRFI